jgi:hypothetical protein
MHVVEHLEGDCAAGAAQGSAVEVAQRRRTSLRVVCAAREAQAGSAAGAAVSAASAGASEDAGAGAAAFPGAGALGRSGQQSPAPSQVQPFALDSVPAGQHAISCALAAAAAPAVARPAARISSSQKLARRRPGTDIGLGLVAPSERVKRLLRHAALGPEAVARR